MTRKELGCAGHFIGGHDCRWHRHTEINGYRISSVGDYYRHGCDERQTLGAAPDSFFETMVFRLGKGQSANNEGCGCRAVADWTALDCVRYATAGDAQKGHEKMVAKYARKRAAK